jgi:hypothetical protein
MIVITKAYDINLFRWVLKVHVYMDSVNHVFEIKNPCI